MPTPSDLVPASARQFEVDLGALSTVVGLTALALVVGALVPRRRALVALAGVSLAVAVGLTVTPFGGWGALGFENGALRSIVTNLEPHRSALTGWLRNPDGPANVVLFLPAGLFLTLLLRRPLVVAAGLTLTSFVIECWQATLTTRVGSFDDVVANALGAALGAAVAGLVLGAGAVRRRRVRLPAAPAEG